jgi:hypothetical protein
MTAPPLPTFIPQDQWYNLTTGQINPSEADTVPNITFLRPSSSPQGMIDGVVGSADGDLIYLAGVVSQLDGGQKFLMWVAASMQVDDGLNVFNPFAIVTKHGRWVSVQPTVQGNIAAAQIILAGGSKIIASSTANSIRVFVKGRSVAGTSTLSLPTSTFLGQSITVQDSNGDAGTNNIIVVAASINGDVSDTLAANYAARTYTWNSTEWSIS